jgi:hypothetical protein
MATDDGTTNKGKWPKGHSGNPAGRPRQSRNKSTLLMEALLEGDAEQLTAKAIEMAKAGDILAMRLCLDRLLPPRRDRPIHLTLPPIENMQQISSAMSTVVKAIGEGSITPTEGETLANVMTVQTNVVGLMATGDLERRVKHLEEALSEKEEADKT